MVNMIILSRSDGGNINCTDKLLLSSLFISYLLEKKMSFEPNYQHILDVAQNIRPKRLPLYEHIVDTKVMEQLLDVEFAELETGSGSNLEQFFTQFCRFFKEMTFDTVSYEWPIILSLPAKGASICGREPGPIQNRKDFESIDWGGIVQDYIKHADQKFEMLGKCMPPGMKAIGGVANGVFEISEDLTGLTNLAYMQIDDPKLFADLFAKIGDLMTEIWSWFLKKHAQHYVVCRFGDDLGFKSGTLISPSVIRKHIIPQYRRVVGLIHKAGKPFLWHSCGCIFDVMGDVIETGIDAKHSNEDAIAPYEKWIELYGDKIGLFGGIDVDLLCRLAPNEVFDIVVDRGTKYRKMAKGFALGSGNSIPDYIPVDGFLAMVRACQEIRKRETEEKLLSV